MTYRRLLRGSKLFDQGLDFYNAGRLEEALECFNQSLKKNSSDIDSRLMRANTLQKLGRYREARNDFDKILKVNRRHAGALIGKANCFWEEGHPKDSIKCLEAAIEIDSRQLDYARLLGERLHQMGKDKQATAHYKKTGDVLNNQSLYSESLDFYTKGLALEPNNSELLKARSKALASIGDTDDSIKSLEQVLLREPDDADSLRNEGAAFLKKGAHEDASRCYYRAGNSFLDSGDNENAIKCFNEVLKIDPENANAWSMKAIALRRQGDVLESINCSYSAGKNFQSRDQTEEAVRSFIQAAVAAAGIGRHPDSISCLDAALELDRDNPEALIAKGCSLRESNRDDLALTCFISACNRDTPWKSDAWRYQGEIVQSKNNHVHAIGCFERSIDLNPINLMAWIDKGRSSLELGKSKEALGCYKKALKIDGESLLAIRGAVQCMIDLREFKSALKQLDKGLELTPRDPELWKLKGDVFKLLNQASQANDCYDKALEYGSYGSL